MNPVFNQQKERSGQLSRAVQCIAQQPLLTVAFTFYWVWVNMVYQTPLAFPLVEAVPGLDVPARLLPILVSVLTHLSLSLWFKRSNAVIRQSWYPVLLVALMSVGSLLCVLWTELASGLSPATSLALYCGASLLIGVGSACLCIEMQRVFGHLGSQYVLFIGCFAMLVSSLAILSLSLLPTGVQRFVLIGSPWLIAYGIRRTVTGIRVKGFFTHGLNARLYIPYKFLITALLHGLSIGTMIGFRFIHADMHVMVPATILMYAVAAILMFVVTVLLRSDYNHLIYQIGFPLVAMGALLVICLDGDPLPGALVQLMGFCFLHIAMWGVCTYMIKNLDLPATWVIATSTCAFMCGQFVGGLVGFGMSLSPGALAGVRVVEAILLFVVLFFSLLLMSSSNLKTGWGLARFGVNVISDASSELACRGLVVEFGLTKREADTLALLVRGKSRKAISEELFVSEETIKSHSQSIYHKLTVHSQQELISLFDERRIQAQLESTVARFE